MDLTFEKTRNYYCILVLYSCYACAIPSQPQKSVNTTSHAGTAQESPHCTDVCVGLTPMQLKEN